MEKYVQSTILRYLNDAASDRPAPGGGSISALAGALGCAMGEMAANFTSGRKKFAGVQADIELCLRELHAAREALAELVDEDVRAYNAVIDAQALPKDTEEEKKERKNRLQSALREAMLVPLKIMRNCGTISRESETLAAKANPYLITDVGVCAILAEAACAAARLNVEVNLKYLKDEQIESEVRGEIDRLCEAAGAGRRRVEKAVYDALGS